jgi:hypothetical protein
MNIHKHMEAIFVVALAAVGFGTFTIDSMAEAEAGTRAPMVREAASSPASADALAVMCAARPARRA